VRRDTVIAAQFQLLQTPAARQQIESDVEHMICLTHNDSKRRVGDTSLHDLPRRKHACTVSIQQQHKHHPWMKRRLTTVVAGVGQLSTFEFAGESGRSLQLHPIWSTNVA